MSTSCHIKFTSESDQLIYSPRFTSKIYLKESPFLNSFSAGGIIPNIIRFTTSLVLSIPPSPFVFTISDTKSDCPAALLFFILQIDSLTMSRSTTWETQLIVFAREKLFIDNILISFDHPFCNIKHIFLIISLHNVSKSFFSTLHSETCLWPCQIFIIELFCKNN